jgi:hypothetical protein
MIRVKLCFVAEGVSTDRETDQFSAFRVLESVNSDSYPVPVPRAAFFSLWERLATDPARCRAELTIAAADQEITPQVIDIDFGRFLRNRCVINVDGLVISKAGDVVFRLAIPGHDTAEWTLAAKSTGQPAMGDAAIGPMGSTPLYQSVPVSYSAGTINLKRR